MSDIAISVENLSKRYNIGARQYRHDTLRDVLSAAVKGLNPLKRKRTDGDEETIWALKDVSFKVKRGEVLGIIGRNGAGKSTLLKILSRITEPTSGRAIINGRVGSLLEVGTGFHPELTGRENIYLNGAILGMHRVEIDRKFDEIVAFSEIEKFLDTPVKRYSSGMYVRLAFAVAAHLDPEILLVDEVLAVGDIAFQKKCLGRMEEVSKAGRTVLMVSHNMIAVKELCRRSILLSDSTIEYDGLTEDTVTHYQETIIKLIQDTETKSRVDRIGDGTVRINAITITDEMGSPYITTGSRLRISIGYNSRGSLFNQHFLIGIYDQNNVGVLFFDSSTSSTLPETLPSKGFITCLTESIPLTPRRYFLNIAIKKTDLIHADYIKHAAYFDVLTDNTYGSTKALPPHILIETRHEWLIGQ